MAPKTLIFSDSICQFCYLPDHADFYIVRGATIHTLICRVKRNLLNYSLYNLIIIHVGTNDVDNGRTPDQISEDYSKLIAEIRARTDTNIVISAIIPRPKDFDFTNPIITGPSSGGLLQQNFYITTLPLHLS